MRAKCVCVCIYRMATGDSHRRAVSYANDYCAVNKFKCTTVQTQNVCFKRIVISVPAYMYGHMETGGWEVGQFLLKVLYHCLEYL